MGSSFRHSPWLAAMLVVMSAPALSQSSMYFDFNGATPGSGVGAGGVGFLWTTSGNPLWTTSSAGTASTQDWLDGWRAVISAGTDCTGFGLAASMASGSTAPEVGAIRVEECDFRISQNTLHLTANPSELDVQGASRQLIIGSALSWPSGGTIRKTGPGLLAFEGSVGDGGTPFSTSFQIENGNVQLGSSVATNWLGGSSNASITIGTAGQAGSLALTSADQLRDTTVVNIVNGTFSIGAFSETIRGLTGAGLVSGNGGVLTIHNTGSAHSYSGNIADGDSPVSLVVSGGEQALIGAFGYSGSTTVEGNGRLTIDGSLSASSTVVSDGELASAASQFGDMFLGANGEIQLAIGSSGFGDLDWEGGGRLRWILGPTASAGDSSSLNVASLGRTGAGTLVIVVDSSSQVPFQGQSYELIDFDTSSLVPGDFSIDSGGLLQDRPLSVRVESGSVWLDVGAQDFLFEDRFQG